METNEFGNAEAGLIAVTSAMGGSSSSSQESKMGQKAKPSGHREALKRNEKGNSWQ